MRSFVFGTRASQRPGQEKRGFPSDGSEPVSRTLRIAPASTTILSNSKEAPTRTVFGGYACTKEEAHALQRKLLKPRSKFTKCVGKRGTNTGGTGFAGQLNQHQFQAIMQKLSGCGLGWQEWVCQKNVISGGMYPGQEEKLKTLWSRSLFTKAPGFGEN